MTGVASDFMAVTGIAHDPCRYWYHPFMTNIARLESEEEKEEKESEDR